MCARTADAVPPTAKVKPQLKELTRPYIEREMHRIMEIFFEAGEQSHSAGTCPFCGNGELVALRLTDTQNQNRGGVWCNRCNFRMMI